MSFFRALLAGALLGCSAANAAELRIGLAADVTSVDPHFLNLQPNVNIGWHVFDALTHVDENARLIPGLAVSWRPGRDPTSRDQMRHQDVFSQCVAVHAEDAEVFV